jgi:hypothetical protein
MTLPHTFAVPAVAAGRAPDRLGLHLLLAFGLLLLLVAVVGAMRRAWQQRAERQEEDLPELPFPPDYPGTVLAAPLRGMYLGTVDAGHWLDWIAARGLGGRTRGYVTVYEAGVQVDRAGEAFWIPREAVRGARLERAHAGKVAAPGRLIVVAWSIDGRELETGFRGEDRARQPKVVRAVHDLIGPAPAYPADGEITSPRPVTRTLARLRPRPHHPEPGPQRPARPPAIAPQPVFRPPAALPASTGELPAVHPPTSPHPPAGTPAYGEPPPLDPLTSPLGEVVRKLREDR